MRAQHCTLKTLQVRCRKLENDTLWVIHCVQSLEKRLVLILICVSAGIVVDLFYQGEVLPQLQEVCDFSDYAANLLVLPAFPVLSSSCLFDVENPGLAPN